MTGQHPHDEVPSVPDRARAHFEAAVDSIDASTVNRLRLMRRDALASGQMPARRAWLVPSAAAVAAALAIGFAWHSPQPAMQPATPAAAGVAQADDVTASGFPSDDEAELYTWLGEAPISTDGGESL